MMPNLLFGDNQFFGINHMSEEKARAQAMRFQHLPAVLATLDAAYENVSEEALARKHLERKRIQKPANEKESARVVRLLVRAGFSTGAIFKILKSWNASDETLAAVESIDVVEE